MTEFGLGSFIFKIRRPDSITLKKGESKILYFWKWWPPGFVRKLIQIDYNGDVMVTVL